MDKNQTEKLYKEYINDVYRYSMFKLRNKDSAEDVTSESFTRLLERNSVEGIKNIKIYLIGIARNIIYTKYKQEKVLVNQDEYDEQFDEAVDPTDFTQAILEKDLVEAVKSALDKLEDTQKEVLSLKIWDELQFNEITEIVKLNENSVKTLYYRGVKRLQEILSQKEETKKAFSVAIPSLLFTLKYLGGTSEYLVSNSLSSSLLNNLVQSSLFINLTKMSQNIGDAASIIGSSSTQALASQGTVAAGAVAKGGILSTTAAKVIAAIGGVVVIGGAGAGGVLVYENSKDDNSNQTAITCTYDGKEYSDGDTFDSTDGCNSCDCADGEVTCTLIACEGQVSGTEDWSTFTKEGVVSIKYPPSLKMQESDSLGFYNLIDESRGENYVVISLDLRMSGFTETYAQAVSFYSTAFPDTKVSEFSLGTRTEALAQGPGIGSPVTTINYIYSFDSRALVLSYSEIDSVIDRTTFDKIALTVQLLNSPASAFDIQDSQIVYSVGLGGANAAVFFMDNLSSTPERIAEYAANGHLSNDGKLITYVGTSLSLDETNKVYVYNIANKALERTLTFDFGGISNAFLSPDQSFIMTDSGTGPERAFAVHKYPTQEYVGVVRGYSALWLDSKTIVFSSLSDINTPRPWGTGEGAGISVYNIETKVTTDLLLPTDLIDYGLKRVENNKIYYMKREVTDVSMWYPSPEGDLYSMNFDGSAQTVVPDSENVEKLIVQKLPAEYSNYRVVSVEKHKELEHWYSFVLWFASENYKVCIMDVSDASTFKDLGYGNSIDW